MTTFGYLHPAKKKIIVYRKIKRYNYLFYEDNKND
jgi:hypothetical protein